MNAGREQGPGSGGQDPSFEAKRPGPDEYFPKVGRPEQTIRAIKPVFGEELVDLITKQMVQGPIRLAKLTLKNTGPEPQELSVEMVKPEGSSLLEIELSGDWGQEIVSGVPLIAPFTGKVFRARNPQEWKEDKPISKENDRIEPGAPIAISSTGKNVFFPFSLSEREFPNGARLLRFSPEFNPNDGSMDVTKDESVVCFVEKID
jgi:hypothetical protein